MNLVLFQRTYLAITFTYYPYELAANIFFPTPVQTYIPTLPYKQSSPQLDNYSPSVLSLKPNKTYPNLRHLSRTESPYEP